MVISLPGVVAGPTAAARVPFTQNYWSTLTETATRDTGDGPQRPLRRGRRRRKGRVLRGSNPVSFPSAPVRGVSRPTGDPLGIWSVTLLVDSSFN